MAAECPDCRQEAPVRAIVLRAPADPATGAVQVLVERVCMTWGCRSRLQPFMEPSRRPQEDLDGALARHGLVRAPPVKWEMQVNGRLEAARKAFPAVPGSRLNPPDDRVPHG